MGIGKIGDLSNKKEGSRDWKVEVIDENHWCWTNRFDQKKKIGADLNVQIMREGNRRLDFIQKEMGIRQIGDLT